MSDKEPPPNNLEIGDFRIERMLGAGGMGVVYQAQQVSLNRPVALKVLGNRLTRDRDIARFRREAQAAAKLHHPGIASIYYAGQDDRVCYIAMELIDGVPLRVVLDRLARAESDGESMVSWPRHSGAEGAPAETIRFDEPDEAPAPGASASDQSGAVVLTDPARRIAARRDHIRRSCEIIRDACAALAHAHERGVVHRDLKPENLMVDRAGHVHIIDFGISRFFEDATLTFTGQLVGTPLYMSPEQVTGRVDVDHRSDIYSLGMVLYELLTLRAPITGATRESVLRQIVTKALPPLHWRNAAIDPALEAIVHKATAKDPEERYQAAREFADDFENYLGGRPVAATPYRYRFDSREIVAARPQEMILVGFWFFGAAFQFAMLAVAEIAGILRGHPTSLGYIIGAPVAVAGFLTAQGLLSGRTWAWWVGLACALVSMPWAGSMLAAAFVQEPATVSSSAVYAIVMAGSWTATAVILLRRKTRDWFRLARRLQAEHERQRSGDEQAPSAITSPPAPS
jgi:serine/threonine protein kinase